MNLAALQSLLEARLGDAYTHEIRDRAARVRQTLVAERLRLLRRAQMGEIDGETFAVLMNEAASRANTALRPILGEHFDDVVGVEEGFVLVDPEIAKELDYTQIDPSEIVTRTDVYDILQDPRCMEILEHLSTGPLPMSELAARVKGNPKELQNQLRCLEERQLISAQEPRSLSWRVQRISSEGGDTALLITDDSGEQQLFSLTSVHGLDLNEARQLAAELTGLWEYECLATSYVKFNDQENGRGGIMEIVARAHSRGVDATISARRLWFISIDGEKLVAPPVQWEGEGGVMITRAGLSFRYTIEGEAGHTTEDIYRITDEPLKLLNGTFNHIRTDGQQVKGEVTLRKMRDRNDLQQAPILLRGAA